MSRLKASQYYRAPISEPRIQEDYPRDYSHISQKLNEAIGELEKKFGLEFKNLKTSARLTQNSRGYQFLDVQVIKEGNGESAQIPITVFKQKSVLLALINTAVKEKRTEGYNIWT